MTLLYARYGSEHHEDAIVETHFMAGPWYTRGRHEMLTLYNQVYMQKK